MAAGKRNGERCACHLLRWEPAAASPGGSALPPAPAPAAPEAPWVHPFGAQPLHTVGKFLPQQGEMWGGLQRGACLGLWLGSRAAQLPLTLWAQRGWRCPRLLGGCSLLGRLGLGFWLFCHQFGQKGCKHPQNVCAPSSRSWEVASGCAHGGFAAHSPESRLPRETAGLSAQFISFSAGEGARGGHPQPLPVLGACFSLPSAPAA